MRSENLKKSGVVSVGILIYLMIFLSMVGENNTLASDKNGGKKLRNVMYSHLTTDDTVAQLVNHPAFKGFGPLLMPMDHVESHYNTKLGRAGSLMPYHNHVKPDVVVSAVNYMIDQVTAGQTIFYDFYSENQKQENPSKETTGLFCFRGKPGAPFAVICPGGGFSYVGSLHEGFPLAVELNKKGYHAFVLKYRIGSEQLATEDLAAAVSYIFKNAEMLDVGTGNYSIWGGSAGARMVGNIALSGTAGFGGDDLPAPRMVVIAYTGQAILSENYPPTFITVSQDDGIVSVPAVDRRVEHLRKAGVDVEYLKFRHAGHGFGTGVGTDAEGWMAHAIRFWEKH